MDCVNHPGVNATAYCQNCGKAMCSSCVRQEPGGQILCEPCWTAWRSMQSPLPVPPAEGPSPAVAAVLGFIPGVGAMYNGQFIKGFIHVGIFAGLVIAASHFGIFGLFIAAWVLYQPFEAYHTAKARRDGEPLPDPLGLNDLADWVQSGFQSEFRRSHAGGGMPPAGAAQGQQAAPGYGAPYQAPYYPSQYQGGYQDPRFASAPPFVGAPPAAGFAAPPQGYVGYPPVPPPPYWHRRRSEPIAAIVLIALGVLFLVGQMDWFSTRAFEYSWPLLLIGLGAWLFFRRMREVTPALPVEPGNPGGASGNGPSAGNGEDASDADNQRHGGSL